MPESGTDQAISLPVDDQTLLQFKWIKQHLRIEAITGTTDTVIETQIWTVISVIILVAIAKKSPENRQRPQHNSIISQYPLVREDAHSKNTHASNSSV